MLSSAPAQNYPISGGRGEYHVKDHLGMTIGGKVIVVADGGTIEIHGQKKLPWTKLTRTLPKLTGKNGMLFEHQVNGKFYVTLWNLFFFFFNLS